MEPAPFCKLFAGLGSTKKSATFFLFSPYLTLVLFTTLSSLLSFLLSLSLRQKLFSISSCSIRRQWIRGYSFLSGNHAADELARRGALLASSAFLCSLYFLVSRIHSCFFRTGGVLSHQNFLTHRFPRFPPRNLCSLVTLAVCFLVVAATNTVFF